MGMEQTFYVGPYVEIEVDGSDFEKDFIMETVWDNEEIICEAMGEYQTNEKIVVIPNNDIGERDMNLDNSNVGVIPIRQGQIGEEMDTFALPIEKILRQWKFDGFLCKIKWGIVPRCH